MLGTRSTASLGARLRAALGARLGVRLGVHLGASLGARSGAHLGARSGARLEAKLKTSSRAWQGSGLLRSLKYSMHLIRVCTVAGVCFQHEWEGFMMKCKKLGETDI